MLSYMLPVEDKTSPRNLNLNLNLNRNGNIDTSDTSKNLINFERSTSALKNSTETSPTNTNTKTTATITHSEPLDNSSIEQLITSSILSTSTNTDDSRNVKMTKIGNTKNVTLKRVSFGSSKGSMVETLVFETPTPLPEHAEREFHFSPHVNSYTANTNHYSNNSCLDDSGIEIQEELERSKVRVSFFQSSKPQQISPPDNCITLFDTDNLLNSEHLSADFTSNNAIMTTIAVQQVYDRQLSTESGWDNPFRPGGDLSREADEIVNMIKGGKPITPTGDGTETVLNGAPATNNYTVENGGAVVDNAVKSEASQLQSAQNGKKSPQKPLADKKGSETVTTQQTQISNQVIPGPQSASHVVIDEKKKKKCTCCVIQ